MSDEEIKQEEKKAEPVDKTMDLITKATQAAERLEKANKQMDQLLTKQAMLKAEQIIGGKSDAGGKQETEEDKEIAAAKAMLAGTGLEEDLFPEK